MRVPLIVTVLAGAAALYTVGAAQQQEMLTRPGPGSGITRVDGTVNIGNSPSVHAAQEGEWRVRAVQDGDWRVSFFPAQFLKTGAAYVVVWPDGSKEKVAVVSDAGNGWVRIDGASRRWINLATARSIEEAR